MNSKKLVVGIGEVLMDVFEDGEVTLGGAPFNVTYHLHQLLAALSMGEGLFVSAVGKDAWGSSILSAAASAGMSTEYLARVDHPTGSAMVFERDGGAGHGRSGKTVADLSVYTLNRCASPLFPR